MSVSSDRFRYPLRQIKSFVLREGRMTEAQQRAFAKGMPIFGLDSQPNSLFDLTSIFQRQSDTVLEIGFGNGESLVAMAEAMPDTNFIGIEVHRPGIGNLLIHIEKMQLNNIRIIRADAIDVLENNIPANSIRRVNLFFPDPWPKTRHHKRRIVQDAWVALIASKLKTQGVLHIATDWANYAEHVRATLANHKTFVELETIADIKTYLQRPTTKFEQRGIRLGHQITDLAFIKTN